MPQPGEKRRFQTDQAPQPVGPAGPPPGLPQPLEDQPFVRDFPLHQLAENFRLCGLAGAGDVVLSLLQLYRKGLGQGGPAFQAGGVRLLFRPQKEIPRHLFVGGESAEYLPEPAGSIVEGKSLPAFLQLGGDPFLLQFLHDLGPHDPPPRCLGHKDPVVLFGGGGGQQGIGRVADRKTLAQVFPGCLDQRFQPAPGGQLFQQHPPKRFQMLHLNLLKMLFQLL